MPWILTPAPRPVQPSNRRFDNHAAPIKANHRALLDGARIRAGGLSRNLAIAVVRRRGRFERQPKVQCRCAKRSPRPFDLRRPRSQRPRKARPCPTPRQRIEYRRKSPDPIQ